MTTISSHCYRPEIDGLRAIAVLSVILFHFRLGVTGGFIGVDVFFVISGCLIGNIILRESEASQFTMISFWERRIRRIAPALVTVVLSTLIAGWFLLLPKDFLSLGASAISLLLFVANGYFWTQSGYFAAPAESKPLLHCWSLAVEEQFYLVFPLFLVLLIRLFGFNRTRLTIGVASALFMSLCICTYMTKHHRSVAFYFLPTRAWELLAGCLLATFPISLNRCPRLPRELLTAAGLLLILTCCAQYSEKTVFPGSAAVLPVAGATMFLWAESAGPSSTAAGRLLSTLPLVFVGQISYSLYLWHWPLLVFWKYWEFKQRSLFESAALIAICFLLAVFTWYYIETPIRKRRYLQRANSLFTAGATAMILLLGFSASILVGNGFPSRLPPTAVSYASAVEDREFQHEVTLGEAKSGRFQSIGDVTVKEPSFMVWGDSHAMAVLPAFDELLRHLNRKGAAATHSSTPPTLGYCYPRSVLNAESIEYNSSVLRFIQEYDIRQIVLVGRWSVYSRCDHVQFAAGLTATLDALTADDREVWIFEEVPEFAFDVPRMLAWSSIACRDTACFLEQNGSQKHDASDGLIDSLISTKVRRIRISNAFTAGDGRIRIELDGTSLYSDSNHLSATGARLIVSPVLKREFGTHD